MYLPSEIVREPYRDKAEDIRMGTRHGTVWKTLEEGNVTILYGLSLDPLDSELSQTLAVGWSSPNSKEIIIIDIHHDKVAQRVKLLMDSRYKVKITGYYPNDLESPFNYS